MEESILHWGDVAKAVSAILAVAALVLVNPIRNAIRRKNQEMKEQKEFRTTVISRLDDINDDIGDLQYERLSQAHDYYTTRGWCPTSKKVQLCQMYKSYHAKGRNHLSQYYEQDIMQLKDGPEEA